MANRLIHATSPYLLQHAHNPVDWHEWGEEAIAKAAKEDKPILVSIGYSACHWCHVMEKQSFENEDIARVMNENLVCIKVDREERPDVDQVYMEAVQVLGINGGWPLNVFLTPDQKPFYGGTYFPPAQWKQVVTRIGEAFKARRQEIEDSSNEITGYLNKSDLDRFASGEYPGELHAGMPLQMYNALAKRFDSRFGGIEKAPKFVMPSIWQFLLRYYRMSNQADALNMVALTLRQMTTGGLYDTVGGGFARYSVDGEWFAPHFEKMLYDNAQLLTLYSEMYACTKDTFYAGIVRSTADWLEREMTDKAGGFYSALDADSEGVEGKFYTWTMDEFRDALGTDADAAAAYFHVTPDGNWEHRMNILMEKDPDPKADKWKQKLLEVRSSRVRPGLDDKILAGWNAMTVVGLVDAYNALGDRHYLELALGGARFIEESMMNGNTLYRSFKGKHSHTVGFLEDYGWLLAAYISLYQATFDEVWIRKAVSLCEYIILEFHDQSENYFNFSSGSAERLIARKKEIFDNVIPSSNAVMARNLFRLGTILGNQGWIDMSGKMAGRLAAMVAEQPTHMSHWGILIMEMIKGLSEIAIVGPEAISRRTKLAADFLPFVLLSGSNADSDLPVLKGKTTINGETAIYVCRDKTCRRPVTSVEEALKEL